MSVEGIKTNAAAFAGVNELNGFEVSSGKHVAAALYARVQIPSKNSSAVFERGHKAPRLRAFLSMVAYDNVQNPGGSKAGIKVAALCLVKFRPPDPVRENRRIEKIGMIPDSAAERRKILPPPRGSCQSKTVTTAFSRGYILSPLRGWNRIIQNSTRSGGLNIGTCGTSPREFWKK